MTSQEISTEIINTASSSGVDPRLALEVAMTESGLNQAAVSPAGAIGIFQLMPSTAAALGIDPHDPLQNIHGGIMLLGQLMGEFAGDLAKVLAGYNWGAGNTANAVIAYGSDWLSHAPAETQNYVAKITAAIASEYDVSVGPVPSNGSTGSTASPTGIPGGMPVGVMIVAGLALLTLYMLGVFD